MSRDKTFAWLLLLLVTILCGCSTMASAQVCVGDRCWIPKPVEPQPRQAGQLNVVIPRNGSVDYERFCRATCQDPHFRQSLCPIQVWYADQFPHEWHATILRRGMPYFYYGDNPVDYTVGFDGDKADLIRRLKQIRNAPAERAAEQAREKQKADELAAQKQREADEQAERDRQAHEEAEAQERARQAEEDQRLSDEARDRETDDQEQTEPEDSDHINEPIEDATPPFRERVRPVIREGVKVAGKAFLGYTWPQIAGIFGLTVVSGGGVATLWGGFLALRGLVRMIRSKKKTSQ